MATLEKRSCSYTDELKLQCQQTVNVYVLKKTISLQVSVSLSCIQLFIFIILHSPLLILDGPIHLHQIV